MRRTLTLAALLVAVVVCGSLYLNTSGAAPWHGTYSLSVSDSIDVTERMLRNSGTRVDEDFVRKQAEVVGEILEGWTQTLQVNSDGTWSAIGSRPVIGDFEESGTWRADLGHLFLYVQERDDRRPQNDPTRVFGGSGSLIWIEWTTDGGGLVEPAVEKWYVVYRRTGD